MEETKIIYYLDDDKMPYLIKLNMAPDKATLRDFKQALNSANPKNFKFFFQTIVDDFGVVKEEIMDDDAKLPCVNGRIVSWLMQIEGSIAGSADSRSQQSLNTQNDQNNDDIPTSNNNNNQNNGIGNHFSSMQSISSTTSSNNENVETYNSKSNKKQIQQQQQQQQQIYDTLNNRKSSSSNTGSNKNNHRHVTPLKESNFDDTATETESVIYSFDDLRLSNNHQRPSSSNQGGSMRRSTKPQFSSFNNHQNTYTHQQQILNSGAKQKLSLDSHQTAAVNRMASLPNNHHHHPHLSHNHLHQHHNLKHGNLNPLKSISKKHRASGVVSSHKNHRIKSGSGGSSGNNNDSFSDDDDDDDLDDDDLDDDDDDDLSNFNGIDTGLTRTETTASSMSAPGVTQSILSSDLDTTTFFDTENDDDGQFSSITAETTNSTISSRRYGQNRNRRRMRHKNNQLAHHHHMHHHHNLRNHDSLHSSMTSLTDSTMSLNIITVTLNMDTANFLGISIVGQSNKGGEGGIYVGSIMSGGAVALDGRIEAGDMILQVNDISFENMSNDDAVKVLREAVMKPGPVKLVVAKCWDPNPKGYFAVSKQDPIRPIDPSAWVAHTQAVTTGMHQNQHIQNNQIYGGMGNGLYKPHPRLTRSISSFGSSSSLTSSIADSTVSSAYNNLGQNYHHYHQQNGPAAGHLTTTTVNGGDSTRFGNEQLNLTTNTDMETVVRSMAAPDSQLDVRDRNWLKITISNAFIGSDVVDWLFNHVEGFPERRDARKYACNLLKYGYIKHAVNKVRFSEQCYYIFGDFNQSTLNCQMMMNGGGSGGGGNLFTLNEESEADFDSVSEMDRDALYAPMSFPPAPLPPPGSYNNQNNNIYQHHQPKLYSNLNGIGGPPPPPSYMSSSSSNATSNSTSTTSNNTTAQTIATSTSALQNNQGNNGSFNSNNGGAMTSVDRSNPCQFYYPPPSLQLTSFTNNNNNSSINSSASSSSSLIFQNNQKQQYSGGGGQVYAVNMNSMVTVNQSEMTQYNDDTVNHSNNDNNYPNNLSNPPNSMLSQSQFNSTGATNTNTNGNYVNSNYGEINMQQQYQNVSVSLYGNPNAGISRSENRSIKSSDNSSSGNGSDVELLSSKSKSKKKQQQLQQQQQQQLNYQYQQQQMIYNQSNYSVQYSVQKQQIHHQQQLKNGSIVSSQSSTTSSSSNSNQQQPRSLDKVPRETRSSKSSFSAALDHPSEFFIDVM